MNPISGSTSPQQESKPMQDVVPVPKQSAPVPQTSASTDDVPVQPEIVNDLPVKVQGASLSQVQGQAGNPMIGNPPSREVATNQDASKDDKELDKVLKDVNRKIKADDNKPPKPSIFKRWESVIVTIAALVVAAALCLAAILAFKTK